MTMKCGTCVLIMVVATHGSLALGQAPTTAGDAQPEDDQDEGMVENLADTVPGYEDAGNHRGLLGNLRLILPENLQEMHDVEVQSPDETEGASAQASSSASPVVLERTNKLMDLSRRPLTFIQDKVPFLTKRGILFFGRLELDAVRYTSGILEPDSGLEVRRFRVGLAGRMFPSWENWNYKIEIDLTDGENTISDNYLSWHSHKWGTVRVGNQKVAQTLSGQTSSISTPFMERPLPVLAFTLQRRLGVGYDLHRERWGVNSTVFSHDVNEQVGSQGYAARFYFNPTKSWRHVLHVGASALKFDADSEAQLRARPESNKTNTELVDTGVWEDVDTATAFGLELAGAVGPATITSEFYRSNWNRDDGDDPAFNGWYVEGSWFLTGEKSNYRQGKFIRPDISREGGAWELAARFSTIDLNDEDVEGGTEENLAFGVNWYSPVHWRFMGNVIKVNADGPQGEEDPWIIQFRAQYYF